MATFELSEEKYSNGRRPFTAILYELQPPECVVNDVGTKYNKNGITFLEEYCAPQLDSIKDMSVTVEFLNEEKTIISGHGLTGIEDGMPVFDDASVIGHFTEGYIDNVDTDDGTKRVVIGKGYLDEMRYHSFVEQLESDLSDGVSIEGSIEIYKAKGNKGIIYKNGNPKETGRIPTSFIHSGWTMVSNPSDPTSVLIELNEKNNKEDKETMEFNMEDIKNTISATISELNDKSQAYETQISELNSVVEAKDAEIAEKDAKIVELNASVEKIQATLDQLKKDHETYWAEREILEAELAKAKVAEKLGELDNALGEFNEDEKAIAKEDIEKLTSEINSAAKKEDLENVTSEINSITDKICKNIVMTQKKAQEEARIAEQNSVKDAPKVEDIFSEMFTEKLTTEEDINIF